MMQIDCADRWAAYFRLCELGIDCCCASHQPLQIELNTPHAVVQTWSVMNQITQPRAELVQWLNLCWQL